MKYLTFFVFIAVIALGSMIYSFSVDEPAGMQTVARGRATQSVDCESSCKAVQADLIAAMGRVQQLTLKYEENTKTVKKILAKWQFTTSGLINLSNSTMKNLYPWNKLDKKSNLTVWYQETLTLWKELELIKAEKKKLEIDITTALLVMYELHAKAVNCHITCYCPPTCTLGDRRTRQAMLDCDLDIKQIQQQVTAIEATFISIKAEWDKFWQLTQTIVLDSQTMVALYNQTAFNKLNFTGIGASWGFIKVNIQKFALIEKKIQELNAMMLQIQQKTNEYFSAMLRCVMRKCPTCPADKGESYITGTPQDRAVQSIPRESAPTSTPPQETAPLDCNKLCAERGMSTQKKDWSQQILNELNSKGYCKASATIKYPSILTIDAKERGSCTCHSNEMPQISFGPDAYCKNTPCGDVKCGTEARCENTIIKCSCGGWQPKGPGFVGIAKPAQLV